MNKDNLDTAASFRLSAIEAGQVQQLATRRGLTRSDIHQEATRDIIKKYRLSNPNGQILICGGTGYIGSALVAHLEQAGKNVTVLKCDLTNPTSIIESLQAHGNPPQFETCYLLAADVGGIGYTSQNQLSIAIKNLAMITNFYRYIYPLCRTVIQTSSACIYPDTGIKFPIRETDADNGGIPESIAGYGWAKRVMLGIGHNLPNVLTLILTNVYGEYLGSCESFGAKGHVTAHLIKKFVDGNKSVTLWGDGTATRDFVHVKDVILALVKSSKYSYTKKSLSYDGFNIANGVEVSIQTLADIIADLSGYTGTVVWDVTKPTGAQRRVLDNSRARHLLGWEPSVEFVEGLRGEVEFYKNRGKQ